MKPCDDPTCWPEPHTYFDHAAPPAEVVARIERTFSSPGTIGAQGLAAPVAYTSSRSRLSLVPADGAVSIPWKD